MHKHLLERFVKDQKIPISLLEEPYFSYFLDLFEKDFGTMRKYKEFEKTVAKFPCEQDFLEEYHKIRDRMIKETEALDAYKRLRSFDMNTYAIQTPKLLKGNPDNVYRMDNVGQWFLSIDLRKANFQVLRKFDPEIVQGKESYEDWVSLFTDMEYMKSSKYLRQVVFGKLSPPLQVTMEKFYTKKIFDYLLENGITIDKVVVFTTDEIVLRTENGVSDNERNKLKQAIKDTLDLDVSITSFYLTAIGGQKYFVREKTDGTIEFKNVSALLFPQAYKTYRNLPLCDYDLTFIYEGQKAKFIEPFFKYN